MVSDFDASGATEAKKAVQVLAGCTRSKPWIDTPPADAFGDLLREQVRAGNEYLRLMTGPAAAAAGEELTTP